MQKTAYSTTPLTTSPGQTKLPVVTGSEEWAVGRGGAAAVGGPAWAVTATCSVTHPELKAAHVCVQILSQ